MFLKLGIITHYYKNINYGGVLQAFALCKALENMGFEAEQIAFDKSPYMPVKNSSFKKKLNNIFCQPMVILKTLPVFVLNFLKRKRLSFLLRNIKYRENAFEEFSKIIPHSKEVYNSDTIVNAEKEYDAFITGSDQVWNPKWYYPAYMLSFVSSNKPKISYAASLSARKLSEEQKQAYKKDLADYKAISVREKNAVELLKDIAPVQVECTLDPTLLLSRDDWNEVCSDRVIKQDYVFCYFLGHEKNQRVIAEKFAKSKKLPIVTLPYMVNGYNKNDRFFGNIKRYDISPFQFVSLIKHAKYIFTDSFHAAVFSGIYEKEYFVFGRDGNEEMGTRIETLMALLKSENRFCNTPERKNIEYIKTIKPAKHSNSFEKLYCEQNKSLAFLERALKE